MKFSACTVSSQVERNFRIFTYAIHTQEKNVRINQHYFYGHISYLFSINWLIRNTENKITEKRNITSSPNTWHLFILANKRGLV